MLWIHNTISQSLYPAAPISHVFRSMAGSMGGGGSRNEGLRPAVLINYIVWVLTYTVKFGSRMKLCMAIGSHQVSHNQRAFRCPKECSTMHLAEDCLLSKVECLQSPMLLYGFISHSLNGYAPSPTMSSRNVMPPISNVA